MKVAATDGIHRAPVVERPDKSLSRGQNVLVREHFIRWIE